MSLLSATKTLLLKRADLLLGKFLATILPPPSAAARNFSVCSFLVIRPGGIGDALLLAPALNKIKECFPAASLTILAESRNAGAFALIPGITRILCYDKIGELSAALKGRYDIVIDTEQWHRLSAVIARFASSAVKIGYDTNERSRLLTHRIAYYHDDYEAISFLNLLGPLGINAKFDYSSRFLSIPARLDRETTLAAGLKPPFITLFPGASISERRWGMSRFRSLVRRLAEDGIVTVIVGGPQDSTSGDEIIFGTTGVNLAGKTTLTGTAVIISASALLVSGDSGVLHLGVGLGIPTVSLFGPGISKKWAPRGSNHTVLEKHLQCAPCTRYGYTPRCCNNVRCLAEITIDDVYAAVIKTWHSVLGRKTLY